ncbi:MAG: helix-hairpin-helix domain-containing protein [Firmicutes bacterium]|nr:helix-hairpin-helix domain-containing protein [Bacillota bacterium]
MSIKRTVCIIISLVLLTCSVNVVFAERYATIGNTASGTVIRIIDGDAIEVQLSDTKEIARVKLIGVDTHGYNNARDYLVRKILGANVTLRTDANIISPINYWNYAYVIYNGVNINSEIISKGYGVFNNAQAGCEISSILSNDQRNAKGKGLEIWTYGVRANGSTSGLNLYTGARTYSYTGEKSININTATAEQFKEKLVGVNSTIATAIVKYRSSNPFDDIREIKFVPGVSRSIFDDNKNIMSVCTNMQKATEDEIETLGGLDKDTVNKIVAYRKSSKFTRLADLKSEGIFSAGKYSSLSDYISLSDIESVDVTIGNNVVNANRASVSDMTVIGLKSEDASKIAGVRENGYTMKNLQEIAKIPGISLDEDGLNAFEDNLHTMTNINNCKDSELSSILAVGDAEQLKKERFINSIEKVETILGSSKYESIKDMIYTGTLITEYTNINTATQEQLEKVGFTSSEAKDILAKSSIKTAKDLPVDVRNENGKITLYTNINNASEAELRTLNNGITENIINDIITYRTEQPFGDMEEVKKFFVDENAEMIYNNIRDYIVVR